MNPWKRKRRDDTLAKKRRRFRNRDSSCRCKRRRAGGFDKRRAEPAGMIVCTVCRSTVFWTTVFWTTVFWTTVFWTFGAVASRERGRFHLCAVKSGVARLPSVRRPIRSPQGYMAATAARASHQQPFAEPHAQGDVAKLDPRRQWQVGHFPGSQSSLGAVLVFDLRRIGEFDLAKTGASNTKLVA